MGLCRGQTSIALILLISSFCVEIITAIGTITSTQFLKDPEAIVSNSSTYKLGFFSPVNSTKRYVGIWFNEVPVVTALWVANRNKPLNDSSGILAISKDGNLVVLNGQQEILWSSDVPNPVSNSSAQLSDTGNLVLRDNSGETVWESFQHPSDSFFSKMKLSVNKRTGERILLTSWKSATDPSTGSFSAGLNRRDIPEIFIWKDNYPFFRSGPWNRQVFIGVPYMNSATVDGLNIVDDGEGTIDLTFSYANQSFLSTFALTSQGQLEQTRWEHGMEDGIVLWGVPMFDCEFYGKCGPFGRCNAQASPMCSCLRGFDPKNPEEWYRGNWTSGCIRRKSLQCERVKNGTEADVNGTEADVFLKLGNMKVPDLAQWSHLTEIECKDKCLTNCSCIAYAHSSGIGCMSWIGDLIDIQEFPKGGEDIYIRMAYSESSESDGNHRQKVTVMVSAVIGTIAIAMICALLTWRFMSKRRASKGREDLLSDTNVRHPTFLDGDSLDHVKLQELPLFTLGSLTDATDGFDLSNKLGQGGFGPVYKGKLSDGKEIAVKRLSRASGQGLKEFMNEVEVISKLQHRNLVRLLGCCVEGEEKLLVYEYMPNKSLDAFLFDPLRKQLLDWKKRFIIIEGICRGLLYLHRDSRLRIIHRDLKASNILLDPELKPKISDFGVARIFGGDEDQANTKRVVGTFGYISPEYAMEGRFSEKSDVYSFGVLLLETVSGRRNTSFYGNEQALSLLGFAWKLWNEGDISALVDPAISDPSSQLEIFRCIHIGLLCVQEFPEDRPTASTVVSMLNSEISYLATPKQPPFAERRHHLNEEIHHQNEEKCSINHVTVTVVDGR